MMGGIILKSEYLKLNKPGCIQFVGSAVSETFTKEIQESFAGVMEKNYYYDDENIGFISASVDGRAWEKTMWTRDAGVFLRELVHWGYTGSAFLTARRLIRLCARNPEGFYTFPERFEPGKPDFGKEIDGTSAILVGFSMLARRLMQIGTDLAMEMLEELLAFVNAVESPLAFFIKETEEKRLLPGTGEFGGGMFVEGEYCNVVQNMLAVNALVGWEKAYEEFGDTARAEQVRMAAGRLESNVRKYLVKNKEFIWCVEPEQLLPLKDVLKASANVGFSGINGVGAMACDVRTEKELNAWWGREPAINTFESLLQSPGRKEQYEKYGLYLQFENYCEGMLTSPSYGQGYALQLALSMGLKEYADRLLRYLVEHTENPHEEYILHRHSKYWFYERMLSPDYFALPEERRTVTEGCGALNLVNVAEPLKAARLMAGLNDLSSENTPVPVFLGGTQRVQIRNWAMNENGKLVYRDYDIART